MSQQQSKQSGKATAEAPISVLFVCLGNICRSTMAEGILRHYVDTNPSLQPLISKIDSCGTGDWHIGHNPDKRTMAALRSHDMTNYKHSARQLSADDFSEFDYILAMDKSNLEDIMDFQGGMTKKDAKAKICMYGDFLGEADEGVKNMRKGMVVDDPYYGGNDGFETTWQVCNALAKGFLRTTCGWKGEEGEQKL